MLRKLFDTIDTILTIGRGGEKKETILIQYNTIYKQLYTIKYNSIKITRIVYKFKNPVEIIYTIHETIQKVRATRVLAGQNSENSGGWPPIVRKFGWWKERCIF